MKKEQNDSKIKPVLSFLGKVMLVIIPLFTLSEYYYVNHIQEKARNLVSLMVTSSGSPEYVHESNGEGGSHERYVLKAQEFNCHFWIVGEPLDIIKNNRKNKELLESIQRGDRLTFVISASEQEQLRSLYFDAQLFGISKSDAILFSPGQLKILQKVDMNSTIVLAAFLEGMIAVCLMWYRNSII